MNHQIYEEWLLSDTLTAEQTQELQSHLQTCLECSRINFAWQGVLQVIKNTPEELPSPQFTQRWESRLVERKAQQQRRLTWIVCIAFILGTLISAAAWMISQGYGLPVLVDILFNLVSNVTFFLDRARTAQSIFGEFFESVPLIVPVIIWIAISMSFVFWIIVWALSVWRLPQIVKTPISAYQSHE